jgi:L-threonylcarbamoyladenylate synthase
LATAATSPGQQSLHYAPRAAAFRFETSETDRAKAWCSQNSHRNFAILYFSEHPLFNQMPQNPADYGRVLYSTLREIDAWGSEIVLIEMPPDTPEWLAIRDRLRRATKPLPADFR